METNNQKLERRGAELRVSSDGRTVEGVAIPYNSLSQDLGGFREIILPGAATEAIKADILALYAHDKRALLGRTSSGTLKLREDAAGVHYSINLPNTQVGNDTQELVRRGDVKGASFGMYVHNERWEMREGSKVRVISRISLEEITLTPTPAYTETSAALRSLEQWDDRRRRMALRARMAGL